MTPSGSLPLGSLDIDSEDDGLLDYSKLLTGESNWSRSHHADAHSRLIPETWVAFVGGKRRPRALKTLPVRGCLIV